MSRIVRHDLVFANDKTNETMMFDLEAGSFNEMVNVINELCGSLALFYGGNWKCITMNVEEKEIIGDDPIFQDDEMHGEPDSGI